MAVATSAEVGAGVGPATLTRIQIYKYVTRDRMLEVGDMLSVEAKRSKIAFYAD